MSMSSESSKQLVAKSPPMRLNVRRLSRALLFSYLAANIPAVNAQVQDPNIPRPGDFNNSQQLGPDSKDPEIKSDPDLLLKQLSKPGTEILSTSLSTTF